MPTNVQEALALGLFEIGAVKFGQFRLKLHEKNPDAPLSPIYVDLRTLRSFPDAMDLAVDVYKELAEGIQFDIYADVPTAATPIVAILSHETRVPMISPRPEKKGHGTDSPIDGAFKSGQIALLVDDLITRAESKLQAIEVLEAGGLRVQDVVVLIDREQGGVRQLAERGYRCHSAFELRELLRFYLKSGKISDEQYARTRAYLEESGG